MKSNPKFNFYLLRKKKDEIKNMGSIIEENKSINEEEEKKENQINPEETVKYLGESQSVYRVTKDPSVYLADLGESNYDKEKEIQEEKDEEEEQKK